MKRLILALLFLATLAFSAVAQTDLPNEDKAIVCLDVQVGKMLESEFAKSLGEEMVQEISAGMNLPVLLDKYVRIFGLMGAPNSVQEAMKSRELPFNMLFEFQMVDAAAAKELLDTMQLDRENSQQIGGVEYFSLRSPQPQNIIVGIPKEKSVVLGTKDYVLTGDRKNLFSEELVKTWGRRKAGLPLRASLELVTKTDVLAEVVAMGGPFAPPEMAPMLGLIDNLESLNLMLDMSGKELLALRAMGKSDTDAKELRDGLNGLLGMAKLFGGGMQGELAETPKAAAMMDGMLNDLTTSGEGREVNIIVDRPAELESAVAEMQVWTQAKKQLNKRQNNIRQAVLAIHNYSSENQGMPFEADESKPSWRVAVQPYLRERPRRSPQTTTEEVAPPAPASAPADGKMPKFFGKDGENSMIAHVRTENLVKSFADLRDGSSNTICLIEVKEGIPWEKNQDVTPDQVVEMIESLEKGEFIAVGFYDGSVGLFNSETDPAKVRAMCTPAGGEVISR